jgi:carbon-monoxide dehydrogenase large subunit
MGEIGKSVTRKDAERYVRGKGCYVDDIELNNMLYCVMLRSQYAHARIKKVDVSKAFSLPGVVAIITGKDAKEMIRDWPPGIALQGMKIPPYYGLAVDKVRYFGDPIAAIAAETEKIAEDACELIEVELEPLPPVVTIEDALKENAPLIWEDWENNIQYEAEREVGNVEEALKESYYVAEGEFSVHDYSPMPLESRAIVAQYYNGELTVYGSLQAPFIARTVISSALGIPEAKTRVVAKDVGGSFGQKLHIGNDIVPIMLALRVNGRPVKYIERKDENLADKHGTRDYSYKVRMGFDKDGKITAFDEKIFGTVGSDGCRRSAATGHLAVGMSNTAQAYKMPNWKSSVKAVVNNKGHVSAFRGYGKDTANFAPERILNVAARQLNIDPFEIRLRNLVPPEEFPYRAITGALYDSANFPELAQKARELSKYDDWRKKQEELRKEGKLIGIGVACMIEPNGASVPSCLYNGWSSADVNVRVDGSVKVITDEKDLGQGTRTSYAQIVSDIIGVGIEDVDVVEGDTDQGSYGMGPWSSRGSVFGMSAVKKAAEAVREKILTVASAVLGVSKESVILQDGRVIAKTPDAKSMPLRDLCMKAYYHPGPFVCVPEGTPPEKVGDYIPFESHAIWTSPAISWKPETLSMYCCITTGFQVTVVEVDPETGIVKLLDNSVVIDCGKLVNPEIVRTQFHATLYAITGLLQEAQVYDEEGRMLSLSLADYGATKATQAIDTRVDFVETPSPFTELGTKGMGEGPGILPQAAIVNAVEDALAPLGVKMVKEAPLKPYEILELIKKAKVEM